MSSEWKSYQLGDIFDLVNGFAFKGGEFKSSGIPVIKIKNVKPNNLLLSDLAFVDKDVADKRPDKELKRGDILITMSGNRMDGSRDTWVGKVAYFDIPGRYMLNQRVGVLRPKKGVEVDRKCCSYFLSSDEFQDFFIAVATSSGGQANLSPSQILGEKINLPPLAEQKQIASLLTSLDDRITLLRETNTTLEAIAQALFKSWFVDFDPVHAKMQGRAPEGMDEATADLFPDSFEGSELGPVPKGWRVERLGEVCSYLNRGISPKYLEEGGVLVINQKCIRDFSVDYSKARRHDKAQRKIDGRQLVVGDILVNSTGVGTLGRVAQVLTSNEVVIVDSHVTVVRAGGKLSWPYLGQWMTRQQPNIEAMGEGSTGQTELARSKLSVMPILVPSVDALRLFDEVVTSLKERIAVNEACVSELAKLRDTLLPRLISGQLQLPDAQQNFEEAL